MSGNDLEPEHSRKIFIGGLDHSTTSESLRIPFEPFGEITDCVVICENGTQKSRGFGFVTYAQSQAVDDVIKRKSNFKVDGRQVDLKRAVPRNEPMNETSTKIFVGGLPPSVTTQTLRETFAEFGTVTIAEVMLDRDQISRGFGFITYENPDVVTRLVAKKRVEIDGKAVEVKRAEPRGTLPGGRGGGGGGGRGSRSYDRDDYGGSRDYGGYDRGGARGGARDYGGSRGYSDYGASSGYSYGYGSSPSAGSAPGYGGMATAGYRRDPFADYSRSAAAAAVSPGYGYGGYPGSTAPAAPVVGREMQASPAPAASYPIGTPYAQSPYGYSPQMKGYGGAEAGGLPPPPPHGGGGVGGAGGAPGANRYRPY